MVLWGYLPLLLSEESETLERHIKDGTQETLHNPLYREETKGQPTQQAHPSQGMEVLNILPGVLLAGRKSCHRSNPNTPAVIWPFCPSGVDGDCLVIMPLVCLEEAPASCPQLRVLPQPCLPCSSSGGLADSQANWNSLTRAVSPLLHFTQCLCILSRLAR